MVSLKSALSILFTFVILSILFFIPSERTGFVTQVKSPERILLGYLSAFIALFILLIPLTRRERGLQKLWYSLKNDPEGFEYGMLKKLKLDPYKVASIDDLYMIVEGLGEMYGLPESTQKKMEYEIGKAYQLSREPLTVHKIWYMCLYSLRQKYFRAREKKLKAREPWWHP